MSYFNTYYDNNNLKKVTFYEDSKDYWNRYDGPAVVEYYENGNVKCESWFLDNKLNRFDGPAKTFYDIHGRIVKEEYFVKGVQYVDYRQFQYYADMYLFSLYNIITKSLFENEDEYDARQFIMNMYKKLNTFE